MVDMRYEIIGGVIILVLMGIWIVRLIRRRKDRQNEIWIGNAENGISRLHEAEHRALVYLMAQKTDAILAALAETIAQERQKLGAVVRNPSMDDAFVVLKAKTLAADGGGGLGSGSMTETDSMDPSAGPADRPVMSGSRRKAFPHGGNEAMTMTGGNDLPSPYHRILQLSDKGMDVAAIADQLQMPEAEVSMVVRLNAA